jgi:hypothetical protein
MTVRVALGGAGAWQALGDGLPPEGGLDWDNTTEEDGTYDLRLQFYDAAPQLLEELRKRVLVLNDPGVEHHAGLIAGNET